LKPGDPESVELLRERMKTHIFKVVERYADVVDNWEVVNEAISDNPDETYRDGEDGSKWYEIYGDHTYIYDAFRFAREALEKTTGSARGKLYYNDYNVPRPHKLESILALVDCLRNEKGIPVDGVGLQGHWRLDEPSVGDIEEAIDRIEAAGLKAKISELDISVYTEDDWEKKVWEPDKPFTEALEEEQADRYEELFELFRENKDVITSVTLWGITDSITWLDAFPTAIRDDYPTLFDDDKRPKEAFRRITSF
jgi:endo-1,4-beta-xylanase